MMTRHRFDFPSDTGSQVQFSPSIDGFVRQMRWQGTSGDTGGSLQVILHPSLEDENTDTGLGVEVYNAGLTPDFHAAPVQSGRGADGLDTGPGQFYPYAAAGDRLRVKLSPSGNVAKAGTLMVWTSSED